ncbi:MAG: FitA-like ribbon-helix-helix domain-containing protein [Eggerthellaceae bacterium]
MPALQVRDFPDDLYEQLKAYAASQHRSIAQQTIVAVEQMLEAADAQHYWDGHDLHRLGAPALLDFDTEAKRAVRIEKRKELFAEIDKLRNLTFRMIFRTRWNSYARVARSGMRLSTR